MRRILLLISCLALTTALKAETGDVIRENAAVETLLPQCSLTLPEGWKKETKEMPEGILMIYIGNANKEIIPTINVAWEPSPVSSQSYIKESKKAHLEIAETICKEVGTLNCGAGKLHLLQIDRTNNWGKFRFLQGMIVKNGIAYVITGTASQEDFATLSGVFFKTFQSFNVQ